MIKHARVMTIPAIMQVRQYAPAAAAAAAAWYVVAGKTCVAAYQPKGAASLAASYTNLANPGTYDAAPGSAPTWDVTNGWIFNGSSQYLTTGVTPATSQTWSMLVRFSGGSATGDHCVVGSLDTYFWFLQCSDSSNKRAYGNGNTAYIEGAAGVTSGVLAVAGRKTYLNGAPDTADIAAATGGTARPTYIGARNTSGSAGTWYGGNVQAVAIYSAILTAGEVATVSAAMAAL